MCSPFSIRSSAPTARSSACNKHRRYFAYSSNPPHTFPRGPSKLVPFQLFEPNAQLALAHRVRENYLLILGRRSWNGTRRAFVLAVLCSADTRRRLRENSKSDSLHFSGKSLARKSLSLRREDRKSTRLNSSHVSISYAVFCLKKKKKN